MPRYEYKLVPAPVRAVRHKGLKAAANFAATLEDVLNEMAAEGWVYLRADILPEEVRSGIASKATTYRTLLVFQRPRVADASATRGAAAPAAPAPEAVEEDDDPDLANLFDLGAEDDADADDRPRPVRRP